MVDPFKIHSNPSAHHGGIFYLRSALIVLFVGISALVIAQPKLVITEAKKNFGSVKRGTQVKNEFEISNTGTAPLLITNAEVACSCTSVDYPKNPILPGQKTIVLVTFNTTTVYGRQDRFVELSSNDPAGPHKLRFKGTVSKN